MASKVLAAGADFVLMGGKKTMLVSNKPVVSICAVRTGSGKSQTTRRVSDLLREMGKRGGHRPPPHAVREPGGTGGPDASRPMRTWTATTAPSRSARNTSPTSRPGIVVYAGVDYERILREAEKEADVVIWDGGNNDFPFFRPDLHIVVVDPQRAGHEARYHPGEANVRMADVVIINKIDTADFRDCRASRENVAELNPRATIEAASPDLRGRARSASGVSGCW